MKLVLQRVTHAKININNTIERSISNGIVVLCGITHSDSQKEVDYLAEKLINLRIFDDENGVMNLSALDIDADLLIVSQFTLYGDTRKGRRPSYIDAARPEIAIQLYESFVGKCKDSGLITQTGEFGADMKIMLENDGPVTLILEK